MVLIPIAGGYSDANTEAKPAGTFMNTTYLKLSETWDIFILDRFNMFQSIRDQWVSLTVGLQVAKAVDPGERVRKTNKLERTSDMPDQYRS